MDKDVFNVQDKIFLNVARSIFYNIIQLKVLRAAFAKLFIYYNRTQAVMSQGLWYFSEKAKV